MGIGGSADPPDRAVNLTKAAHEKVSIYDPDVNRRPDYGYQARTPIEKHFSRLSSCPLVQFTNGVDTE